MKETSTMKRIAILLVALLALPAIPGDFVTGNATLPPNTRGTKVDARPLPAGADATRFITAPDINEHTNRIDALVGAAYDLRAYAQQVAATHVIDQAAQVAKDAAQDAALAAGSVGGSATMVTAAHSGATRPLSDWVAVLAGPRWDTLPTPFIASHRGAAALAPENTLPAFDAALAAGAALETDVQLSSDGWPVLIHDTTVDRTTEGTGTVTAMTFAALRALNASDVMSGYYATQIPTLDEYLARYAGRALLMPQAYSLAAGMAIGERIAGNPPMLESTLIQGFFYEDLGKIVDTYPGVKTTLLGNDGAPPSLANLAIAKAWAVGPSLTGLTTGYVDSVKAAGYKVIAYSSATTDRVVEAEAGVAMGVDGWIAFDPVYVRRFLNAYAPSGTVVVAPARFPASGWSANPAAGGAVGLAVSGGYVNAVSDFFVFPPLRLPNASWTLQTNLKLVTKDADTTRYIALRFAWRKDRDVTVFGASGSSGYHIGYRSNGSVEICRDNGSTIAVLGSATWPTLAAGDTFPLTIEVTPTTIKATRTDTGHTLTVTDSTYTRDGFVDVLGATATNRVGIGTTTVTY
jgi:glycerophosphoryl diester phosphodiesterase